MESSPGFDEPFGSHSVILSSVFITNAVLRSPPWPWVSRLPGRWGGGSQPCLELGRLCGVPLHPGGPEPLTPLACSVFTGWVRMSTRPRAQGGTGSRCSDTPAAV